MRRQLGEMEQAMEHAHLLLKLLRGITSCLPRLPSCRQLKEALQGGKFDLSAAEAEQLLDQVGLWGGLAPVCGFST